MAAQEDSPPPSLKSSTSPSPASSVLLTVRDDQPANLDLTEPQTHATTNDTTNQALPTSAPFPPSSPSLPPLSIAQDPSTAKLPKQPWYSPWSQQQVASPKPHTLPTTTPHAQSPLSNELTAADLSNSTVQESPESEGPEGSPGENADQPTDNRAAWWQWSSSVPTTAAEPIPVPTTVAEENPSLPASPFWKVPWFTAQPQPENEKKAEDLEADQEVVNQPPAQDQAIATPKRVSSAPDVTIQPSQKRKLSFPNPKQPVIQAALPSDLPNVVETANPADETTVKVSDKLLTSSSSPPKKTTFWAFWAQKDSPTSQGEMAVSGTPSESRPVAVDSLPEVPPQPEDAKPAAEEARPKSTGSVAAKSAAKTKQHIHRPNLVLPPIEDNFPVYSHVHRLQSAVRRAVTWWAGGGTQQHKFPWSDPTTMRATEHLYRKAPARRVKKVVVIGVHGFFPMKMLRSIIGEPTGTSMKFANEAGLAFKRWGQRAGADNIEIEKIALEGEGKVFSRVEGLYTLLMNWLHHIKNADCVFFAAHSQGTPVACHLLARLISEGHVENKKLGVVGMAGISLGPFFGMDQNLMVRAYSSIESSSLSELFQFQDLASVHSRKYIESLRTIIAHNAKVVFVGSINDQVVPLYSSTCMHVSHPNILRAVYVDGGTEVSPEFISNLISLALRLKNLGCSEHGLIKEISSSLAGSLRGGGHSRIYDEPAVYDLAIRHVLETTDPDPSLPVVVDTDFQVPQKQTQNPYLLPWSLHGMCTEASTQSQLRPVLADLLQEYRDWAPESKVLKDIKYRLSAIQGRL